MANKDYEEVEETEVTEEVETVETEEPEQEETETETVDETEEEEEEPEQEQEPEEEEPEPEPEKPKKATRSEKKKVPEKKTSVKKKEEEDTDAELDAFFEKLRKAKERQAEKEKTDKGTKKESGTGEKTFTQAEFEKALKTALAKRLPSKEEREQFEHWRESQQTLEEKMSILRVTNTKLEEELESLKHENLVIKAGVDKDAVEFVQYKVEKMNGDFDDNLEDFLKANKRYITPKTTIVEAAEHKQKVKTAITKKELDAMGYNERAKFREEHPEEYAKAMGR